MEKFKVKSGDKDLMFVALGQVVRNQPVHHVLNKGGIKRIAEIVTDHEAKSMAKHGTPYDAIYTEDFINSRVALMYGEEQ